MKAWQRFARIYYLSNGFVIVQLFAVYMMYLVKLMQTKNCSCCLKFSSRLLALVAHQLRICKFAKVGVSNFRYFFNFPDKSSANYTYE